MRFLVRFSIIICAILITLPRVLAQQPEATTTTILNIRSSPGTGNSVIGSLSENAVLILEARSADAGWVLVHSPDSSVRGWVSASYLATSVNLADLPVSTEQIGAPAPQPETPEQPAPTGESTGIVTSLLNVRSTPNRSGSVLGQFSPNTVVVIEGRNIASTWLLVRSLDGSLRGWVSVTFVRPSAGVVVANLSVTEEAPAPAASTGGTAPVTYTFSQNVYTIYQRGQALGNRASAYIEIGDSVTVEEWFMDSFGQGDYDLGPYTYLQPTINFFNRTRSFNRDHLTAENGYSTYSMTDPTWANPRLCQPGETLIDCEVRRHRPSVAFIYLVGNDVAVFNPSEFEAYLDFIVVKLMEKGVIPVLTTFGHAPEWNPHAAPAFQQAIRIVAERYQLPLIDLSAALQTLPDQGVFPGEYHLTLRRDGFTSFNGDQDVYGATLRDLLSLQMLHDLRTQVFGQ